MPARRPGSILRTAAAWAICSLAQWACAQAPAGPPAGSVVSTVAETPEPVVQAMHAARISAMAVSARGGLLASGSVDGTVKVWSLRTRELIQTLVVSRQWIRTLAFSADGVRLAAGAGDHVVYLYEAMSGTLLRKLEGADSAVVAVAWSGDGQWLAGGTSRDTGLRIWRVDSGVLHTRLPGKPPTRALAFLHEAGVLQVDEPGRTLRWRVGDDGQAQVVSSEDRPAAATAARPPAPGSSQQDSPMAIDEAGRTVATARGRFLSWSAPASAPARPAIESSGVRAIRFSADDRTLVHRTNLGDVAVWDLRAGQMTHFLRAGATQGGAFGDAVAFTRNGKTVLAARGNEPEQARWSWKLSNPAPPLPADGSRAASSSADSFFDRGMDVGAPAPPMPPFNLRIEGQSSRVTHVGTLSDSERLVYAGYAFPSGRAGIPFVVAEDALTGQPVWKAEPPMTREVRMSAIAASSEGSAVAVAFDDGSLRWFEGKTGRLLRTLQVPATTFITVLQFSPQGTLLAAATPGGSVHLWGVEGQALPAPPAHQAAVMALSFSNDGQTLASGGADNIVRIWDVRRGAPIATLAGHASAVTALAFAHGSSLLASGSEDASMKIWNVRTGRLLATASSLGDGGWLVMSPEGFFDGTREAWNAVPFRFRSAPDRFYRPEQFFSQFFQPGLLGDVAERQLPILELLREQNDRRSELNIASYLNSRLPSVRVRAADTSPAVAARSLRLGVSATDEGSGLRDLRVFRNQSLVKFIHGDLAVDPVTRRFEVSLPIDIKEGRNEITAYAFNRDNLKSEDASIQVVGAAALRRAPAAFIVAVGVNRYLNPGFDLRYAAPDAELIARALEASFTQVGAYSRVVTATLTNEQATKANVLEALRRLAGEATLPDGSLAPPLRSLVRANPEDVVVIYFAGHGARAGDGYYLLPHDIRYEGSRSQIDPASWTTLLASAVSDRDLNDALERIDAAQLMLVIDACHSGRVLESEESRRGPLNSHGIAQLAYEKGAYVLAAAQSNQAALELQRLGHGVLTYTLVEKGIKAFASDADGDGRITAREWFDYASNQVPLEMAQLAEERSAAGRLVTVGSQPLTAQRPRAYVRRDRADDWPIASRNR